MGRCRIKQHLIMTKAEFIQRAVIAIIGNSDFTHSGTQPDEMVEQAKDLAETVEGYGFNFDDDTDEPMESLKTLVGHIGDHLDDIHLALTDGENSIQNRLGEIATDNGKEKALEAVNVSIGNMERCLDRTLQSIDKLIILMAKQQ